MRYVVSSKYTDPDSGDYRVEKLCECDGLENAEFISKVLSHHDDEPNREWSYEPYGKREHVILCVDPGQIEIAWECQQWLAARGAKAIVCFSKVDFTEIKQVYVAHGIQHMVAIVAQERENWEGVDYDLRTSEFGHDEFEVILSVME